MLNANVARIADILEWRAQVDYAQWTSDPDEVRRQRLRDKHAGIVPPPFPLIEPVSARPPSVHAELVAIHQAQREQYAPRREVSRAEFDKAAGIEAEVQVAPATSDPPL